MTRVVSSLLRLLAFVGIFGLIGPAIGGLVVWVTMGARSLPSPIPFVTGAYQEGIVLALTAGLLTGIATLWFGKLSWIVPVGAAIAVNAAFLTASVAGDLDRPDLLDILMRLAGVFFLPSLVGAIVCWPMASRLLMSR